MIMFDETVRAFLEKPLIARLSVNGTDGYPHTVPLWFMRDSDDIVIISDRKTKKVRLIEQNPKGSIIIGGEPNDGAGYLIKGDLRIEADQDRHWLKTVTYRYESGAQADKDIAEWSQWDMIVIRLTPNAVVKVWG